MSKSFTNYHSHTQHTPIKKKRATTKAFETNRRLTIHELASTNYIGVKEQRPAELFKKELQTSYKSRLTFYGQESPRLPELREMNY